MRKTLLVCFLALTLAAGLFQAASFSREGEEVDFTRENIEYTRDIQKEAGYTYGTVVGVSPDRITLNEYNADTGRNEDVTYSIDPSAELDNVSSTREIEEGDDVRVEYNMREGGRNAVYVYVE